MLIREMKKSDWESVAQIYTQALEIGGSTFDNFCPSYEKWDADHIDICRFVAVDGESVAGWIALSHTSPKKSYYGVVEVSIYIDNSQQNKGVGNLLLNTLIAETKKTDFWCLYVAIISSNEASLALHTKCGFRTIGYRERIGKDIFGNWQNTTLMEYRL